MKAEETQLRPKDVSDPRDWTTANLTEFIVRANLVEPWHNTRYVATFEAAWPEMRTAKRILDVGGRSPFTEMLETFTDATIDCDVYDLREPFPYDDDTFDVVHLLEVIEHIKDRDSSNIGELATFTFSGISNCLSEIRRVLKPGGLLVLTTPNVTCYRSIRNVLQHRHPFGYEPHNRELSPLDVNRLLTEANFDVERLVTIDAWKNGGGLWWQWRMALLLTVLGYSTRDRRDDILALARRPRVS
jgi:SAM-dependent methyltransferase